MGDYVSTAQAGLAAVEIPGREILRCEVGSTLHGLGVEGRDDLDLMGVTVEPPEAVTGLRRFEQVTWRSAPEGERSGPDDIDLTVYGLNKWMRLAVKGNPSIILLLYAPDEHFHTLTETGRSLRRIRSAIVSRESGHRFRGYLHSQRQRAIKGKGGHRGKRELRTSKWASHMVRLGLQGRELLSTGTLTLPMAGDDREKCLAVKRGDIGLDEALVIAEHAERAIDRLLERDVLPLPDVPDLDTVQTWMHLTYLHTWRREDNHDGAA